MLSSAEHERPQSGNANTASCQLRARPNSSAQPATTLITGAHRSTAQLSEVNPATSVRLLWHIPAFSTTLQS